MPSMPRFWMSSRRRGGDASCGVTDGGGSRVYERMLSRGRMSERASPCDDLVAFADGELDPDRAAAFREHLRTCERCRRALVEVLQLSARLSELRPRTDCNG